MGWKCSIVIGKSSESWMPALGSFEHDPAAIPAIAAELQVPKFRVTGPSTLDYGIYPHRGDIALSIVASQQGSAESLIAIGDCRAGGEIIASHATHPYVQGLVRRFNTGIVVALDLHSVTNYWGFAVYEHGRFVRAASGAADEGSMLDEGERLPEERSSPEGDEFEGESCVFAISKRIFGAAMWDIELESWPCTLLARSRPWWRFW